MINQPLLLGLGNTSAWAVESEPDNLPSTISSLTEEFGYVPFFSKEAVRRLTVNDSDPDTFTMEGSHYRRLTATSRATLRGAGATHLLLQARLTHSQLTPTSYRSLAIYTNLTLATDIDLTGNLIPTGDVTDKTMVYAETFSPIFKQEGLKQLFRLVIKM